MCTSGSGRDFNVILTPLATASDINAFFSFELIYNTGENSASTNNFSLYVADYNSVSGISDVRYHIYQNTFSAFMNENTGPVTDVTSNVNFSYDLSGKIKSMEFDLPGSGLKSGDSITVNFVAHTPTSTGSAGNWLFILQNTGGACPGLDWNGAATTGPKFPNIEFLDINPKAMSVTDSVSFLVDVNNIGGTDVTLDTDSEIYFTDGSNTYLAKLSAPTLIESKNVNTLVFDSEIIPSLNISINYIPIMILTGLDEDNNAFGQEVSTAEISLNNTAPFVSDVLISPATPFTTDDLNVSYTFNDPDALQIDNSKIYWYVDSVLRPDLNNLVTVLASETSKGQLWNAVIYPYDGFEYGLPVSTASVLIQNTVPSVNDINAETSEDTNLLINLSLSDADNDVLSCSVQTPASLGLVDLNDCVSVNYSPNSEVSGLDSIVIQVSDGEESVSFTVNILINLVNDAPLLDFIGSKSVDEYALLDFNISASDIDSISLTYSAENLPAGAIFDSGTQNFSWVPSANTSGNYDINFIVSDGSLTDSEIVTITVGDKTAPTLTEITPVPIYTNDITPEYIFSSDENGVINYSGECTSTTVLAVDENNIIEFNALSDGTYSNCEITVTDTSSNTSNALLVSPFTIDTIPPNVNITSPINGETTGAIVIVETIYDSDVTSIEVLVDTNIVDTNTPALINLSEGTHSITVRVSDSAGNDSNDTITIYADATPPVIGNILSPLILVRGNSGYVDVNAYDNISTDLNVIGIIKQGSSTVLVLSLTHMDQNGDSNSYYVDFNTDLNWTNGTYFIEVIATDNNNNSSSSIIDFNVIRNYNLNLAVSSSSVTSGSSVTISGHIVSDLNENINDANVSIGIPFANNVLLLTDSNGLFSTQVIANTIGVFDINAVYFDELYFVDNVLLTVSNSSSPGGGSNNSGPGDSSSSSSSSDNTSDPIDENSSTNSEPIIEPISDINEPQVIEQTSENKDDSLPPAVGLFGLGAFGDIIPLGLALLILLLLIGYHARRYYLHQKKHAPDVHTGGRHHH